jgi:hypothetical protein
MAKGKRCSATDEETQAPAWPEPVVGGKYVRLLQKQLAALRTREEAHGNRQLFLDDVFVTYLLAFFNPTIRSLRTIEDFSQTRQVQRHLSITKLCRSTLSDFHRLADPQRLEPILQALRQQLGRKEAGGRGPTDSLTTLLKKAVAVDGTFLEAAAEIAWALRGDNQHGREHWSVRLDFHVRVADGVPELVVLPDVGQSESDSAAAHVQAERLYLYDRGFSGYDVINAHYHEVQGQCQAKAHFVIRYKPAGANAPALCEAEDRGLTPEDRAAGVISDRLGRFRSSKPSRHALRDVPLREVLVRDDGSGEEKTLRLITNVLDAPAKVIAQLYRWRWQIELFFRWLKCFAGFNHLISHCREGVLLHFYTAVIGAMLTYLHSGCRPSKYLFVLLGQVACGAASWEEIQPILQERERQREVERRTAALRREKKKSSAR